MATVDSTEKAFSNRWREGAEEILAQEKPVKMPKGLDQELTRANPTKEEYQKRAIDAGKFIAEMTPIIGDAMAAKEIYDEIQREDTNWLYVGALGGAAVIGLIPGLGDAAAKLIKKGAEKALDIGKRVEVDPNALGSTGGNLRLKPKEKPPLIVSNREYDARIAELDKAKTAKEWQDNAKELVTSGRVADPVVRTPELEESAKKLIDGKITRKQHLEKVDEFKPVGAWDDLPREPSDKAVVFALNNEQREMGNFILPNAKKLNVKKSNIKIGDRFLGRLDIPAYKAYDTWIITGVTPKGDKGSTYAKAIHYTIREDKPVIFKATQAKGEKIGVGEEGKVGYATIDGNVKDLDVDAIRAKALKYLNDPEWTQVGFDPRRQAGFYVRAGENKHVPVREATEVIQIGPLILAKNAKLDFDHKGYNKGGMMEQQMSLFEEGGMKDDGLEKDPVSGNDIPPGSLAKEVRDDIPAQLSDGEYVVPADVVQYFGVKFFEDLRMEAKSGLKQMDETGRIGGEPMSMTMIAIGGAEEEQKERQKKALGGVIHANKGPLISPRQKEMNEITKAGFFNFGDAGVTGYGPYSALGQVNQQNLAKQGITHAKTFYHPELGSKTVWGKLVMVNGQQKFLPNPNYEEFTKSPWSEKPFTAAQPQTTAKKERDEPSALEMEARNRQSAESLKISAERLNLSPEVYGNLSFFQRFRLAGEEIKAMKGQKVNQDKIDTIVNDTGSSFNAFDMFKAAAKFALMTATGISPLIAGAAVLKGSDILGGFKGMIDEDSTTTPSRSTTNKKTDPKKEIDEDWSSDADEFNPSGKPPPKYSSDAGIQKGQEASASRYTGLAQSPTVKAKAFNEKYAVDESDADSFDDLNKGGLLSKPKRTPKKPRGKGLGNRK